VLARLLRTGWRWVLLGAATWLSALPALLFAPFAVATWIGNDPLMRGIVLSFTAGIAEETMRYVYYRRSRALAQPTGRRFALLAGAGHGGVESFLFGLLHAIPPLTLAFRSPAQLLADEHLVRDAVLLGSGRILFLLAHVGFSILVWRAVAHRRPALYALAVGLHVAIDLTAVALTVAVPAIPWEVVYIPITAMAIFAAREIWLEYHVPRGDS
jgi:uncharacterized membrane protein YhfC